MHGFQNFTELTERGFKSIDFRNKIFVGTGWTRNLPKGMTVTLIKVGQMYPDTLYFYHNFQ